MSRMTLAGASLLAALLVAGCAASAPTPASSIPTVESDPATQSPPDPAQTPPPTVAAVQTGQITTSLPDEIDAGRRYVIYLHGRIIEDEGTRPVSPIYGLYEYEETLDALADAGLHVIAEVRPAGTDSYQYGIRAADQVKALLDAGVPAEHVTVMGFSKGGGIAIIASSMLEEAGVNFVLLAICGDWISPDLTLNGRILSLYETSDEYGGSCRPLADASPGVTDFEEIALSTGKQHGAFYTADPLWLEPVIAWILAVP